jgi:hypothetical protein
VTRAAVALLLALLVGCATRPAPDPTAGIRAVLDDYRRAIATHDLGLLLEIWPGLTDEQIDVIEVSFGRCSQSVEFEMMEIDVLDGGAEARVQRVDRVFCGATILRNRSNVVIELRRAPPGWVIERFRILP